MLPKSETETKLDGQIIRTLDKMAELDVHSEEYNACLERLSKLHKLKSEEEFKLPSMDTMLAVGANIFGILWLARYERENVIKAPKAFGLVLKPRY